MHLHPRRIRRVVASVAWTGGWSKLEQLAAGVIDVVNAHMVQAIRLISVERGHDPRDFALVAFGGAGGLHAAALAAALGIPRVIVPPHPGALSALGLLLADSRKDYSETLVGTRVTRSSIRRAFARLHRKGRADLKDEGFRTGDIKAFDFVDVRYVGQSYELIVPFRDDWEGAFHRLHQLRYGHANPGAATEAISVRSTLVGRIPKPRLERKKGKRSPGAPLETVRVWDGRWTRCPVYDRGEIVLGQVVAGPAVIGEYSSTTYVPGGFRCRADEMSNLILTPVRR